VSFRETCVEADGEILHFKVRLGFSNWSNFVFDFLLQVEVKLVSEGFVVPLYVLFLRLEPCRIFCCRVGLMETADFSYCGSLEIGIPVDDGEGLGEDFEGCEFGRGRFIGSLRVRRN
jgi:hypothetical protein